MSFIPSGKSDDSVRDNRARPPRDRKVEKFGAGLEKGPQMDDPSKGRGGRTERRHGARSGSKNAFRRR